MTLAALRHKDALGRTGLHWLAVHSDVAGRDGLTADRVARGLSFDEPDADGLSPRDRQAGAR